MAFAITGFLLTIVGLLYTYTAHPIILERIKRNPSSALSRVASILFPVGSVREAPSEISLYDVIYNPALNAEMYADLSDERKHSIAGYLGRAKNWKFVLTEEFKLDLKREKTQFDLILTSIIVEFASHNYFISRTAPVYDREMATRRGYFVTASLHHDPDDRFLLAIHLKRLCKIENEMSDTQAWSDCRDRYFICKMLPYRYVFKANPGTFMNKGDGQSVYQEICSLEAAVNRYLASAVDLSKATRVKFAGLSQKMSAILQQLEDLLRHEEYSELCIRAEISLSYAHKIIFGNSAISENAIVSDIIYQKIDDIWSRLSMRMRGAVDRPASSMSPRATD